MAHKKKAHTRQMKEHLEHQKVLKPLEAHLKKDEKKLAKQKGK